MEVLGKGDLPSQFCASQYKNHRNMSVNLLSTMMPNYPLRQTPQKGRMGEPFDGPPKRHLE